jgi:predicted ABC-type ATPase
MIAGPNGSGKTTLTNHLRALGVDFGEYINPDDIAADLDGTYDDRVRAAQAIADKKRDDHLQAKKSFSFETVMSHESKIDVLRRARSAGFQVYVYFVGTGDPQTNVDRVAARVRLGGHDVARDRIVARWHRTMQNLRFALTLADEAFVFDNSSTEEGPKLMLHLKQNRVEKQRPSSQMPDWIVRFALPAIALKNRSEIS